MNCVVVIRKHRQDLPVNWWRWMTIGLAVTVLCSCSALPDATQRMPSDHSTRLQPTEQPARTQKLAPVVIPDPVNGISEMDLISGESILIEDSDIERLGNVPESTVVICPPPDVVASWPRDEYLCDGGDGLYRGSADSLDQRGIEPSDTIAQFDGEFSRGHVVASNRVCIYSPRFASTRKVIHVRQEEVLARVGGLYERTRAAAESRPALASIVAQDFAPQDQISQSMNHELYESTMGLLLDDVDVLAESSDRIIPFESRRAVETIQLDGCQQLIEDQNTIEVLQWTNIDSVELAIDGRTASSITNVGPPASVYTYAVNRDEPQLRLEKSVSTGAAEPGDTIDITIHYQNIGETPINNLRIVDNLATRFEFVPDSNESTRRALFSHSDNSVDSVKLVWEIRETIEPQQAGEVQFRCKIR